MAQRQNDKGDMSVRLAGKKGGEKVRRLVKEGEELEQQDIE